jgi:hypothetical protein
MYMQRNLIVMLIGAIVLTVVATTAAPAPASANDTRAFIGGLILGGIIGAALDDNDRGYRGYGYAPRGYYAPPPYYRDRNRGYDRGYDYAPRRYDSYRYDGYRDGYRDGCR